MSSLNFTRAELINDTTSYTVKPLYNKSLFLKMVSFFHLTKNSSNFNLYIQSS